MRPPCHMLDCGQPRHGKRSLCRTHFNAARRAEYARTGAHPRGPRSTACRDCGATRLPGKGRCRACYRAHNRAWWANRTPDQVTARNATARAWKDDNRWRDIHYQMRKRGARTIIMFTPEQRAQRFSMFAGCWLCGRREGLQGDHVKPLGRGGPHCLANIRPCCPTCNWLKGDQWPLPARHPGLRPARGPAPPPGRTPLKRGPTPGVGRQPGPDWGPCGRSAFGRKT